MSTTTFEQNSNRLFCVCYCSFSISLSLSLIHSHTRTHARTLTRTRTHAHTLTRTRTHALALLNFHLEKRWNKITVLMTGFRYGNVFPAQCRSGRNLVEPDCKRITSIASKFLVLVFLPLSWNFLVSIS